ncbi:MAG TPA: ABC transporter permease subunit [Chloroflexota bacterium]|jgi:iron(III) transport system permease protein
MATVSLGRLARAPSAALGRPPAELLGGLAVLAVVGIVTLVPLCYLVINSFNVAPLGRGFTWGLDGWVQAFTSPQSLSALGYSALLATRVFLGIALAFLIAWLLIRVRIPGHRFVEFSLWIAWFLPPLPIAIGWIALLDPKTGLVNLALGSLFGTSGGPFDVYSILGILWVHMTLLTVPIATILLAPAFRRMDASLEEAARASGAGTPTVLRRIYLPLLFPAMLTVVIASFIRSLEAFEIEQVIGIPAGIYVYGTRIYDLVHWDPPLYAQAMALSTIFLAVLLLLVLLYQRVAAGREVATLGARAESLRPTTIGRWRWLATAALLAAVAVGIYLPLAMLIAGSFMKFFGMVTADPFTLRHWQSVFRDPAFTRALQNSLVIGVSVAVVGVSAYALLGYCIQRSRLFGRAALNVLVWLPWAIPGILIGLALGWMFISLPGVSVLYKTLPALILALIIKELPIGTQMIRVSIAQISPELEHAARVSGAGWLATFLRIQLPLIAPMLVSVFLLVFMASLRDVSTTVLLASAASTPLSVLMLERFMTGSKEAASVIGVLLSATAIAMALIMGRLGLRAVDEAHS